MRYGKGWIKLHRALREKELYQDLRLRGLAVELLLISNYAESKILTEAGLRTLLPGQTLISTRKMAAAHRLAHSTFVDLLSKLERYEFLVRESVHRGTIITICNWSKYQLSDTDDPYTSPNEIRTLSVHFPYTSRTQPVLQEELKNPRTEERKKQESEHIAEPPNGSLGVPDSDPPTIVSDKPKRIRKPQEAKPVSDGSRVWAAYAAAYEKRWSTPPVRNAKTNSLCAMLVKHLGAEEAPLVAEFYVSHSDRQIVQQLHPLNLLVHAHQRFRTEWAAGQQMTSTMAQKVDKNATIDNVFRQQLEKMQMRERTVPSES